jgi:DNA-binding winged helix-turn-helix (wHTH) protein/tetratricopeptide (TPR) repeat protein
LKKLHWTPAAAPDEAKAEEGGGREPQAYVFGPFRLIPGERSLRRGERILPLPPKAFDTLLLLARNAGHLMRKEDLLGVLWPDTFVEEVNLANKISLLRKTLGDAGYIQTVAKIGYRFTPPVTRVWSASAPAPGPRQGAGAERATRFLALPFEMANAGEEVAFLGHSLAEAIAASLAGVRSLTVRSTLLGARLAQGGADPRKIAEQSDVDMLLTGRMVCEDARIRVQAELMEARTATIAGSFTCEARRESVFEIQDSLARRIVELLLPKLGERELGDLGRDAPASARAYEFYLRATHVERERTFENMCVARDLYRRCVDEDPDYAPAWARLGRCYRFLQKFQADGKALPELAEWAFRRAFALNPDLPCAHHHYTHIEADAGRAQAAMVRLLGQAERRPNDPELFAGLVQATRYCGLLGASLRAHERARSLDPNAVTSVAHTHFLLGDYERTLALYPPGNRFYLDAAALALMGREADARAALGQRTLLAPLVESLRLTLDGDLVASIAVVRQALADLRDRDPEIRFYLARHLVRNGAPREALRTIGQLAGEGFVCSTALRRDPWLRPLAETGEFGAVAAAVELREAEARMTFEAAGSPVVLG